MDPARVYSDKLTGTSTNATGRMVMGIMASLGELELELQREAEAAAKAARKARDLPMGRPKVVEAAQLRQAVAMRASGEPIPDIANTPGSSLSTVYRVLRNVEAQW